MDERHGWNIVTREDDEGWMADLVDHEGNVIEAGSTVHDTWEQALMYGMSRFDHYFDPDGQGAT